MGNRVFKTAIELPGGIVLPDDLGGGGGATVHVGDDSPQDSGVTPEHGSLWIDTDDPGPAPALAPRMMILTDPTDTRNLYNAAHADWNTVYYGHPDWSVGGISMLYANFSGMAWFTANLEITSLDQRANLRVLIEKNGSGSGPYLPGAGGMGYIRSVSGHNESSIYIRAFDPDVKVGDEYRVRTVNAAISPATINAIPEGSYFSAERVL